MKKWAFGLLLFTSCASVNGKTFWSDDAITNTAIITANALFIVDWAQTRYIADNPQTEDPNGYYERGIAENFIGRHPTTGEVNKYFAASIILTNLTGYFMPPDYKKWFYFSVSAYEASYIYDNSEIGIRGQF